VHIKQYKNMKTKMKRQGSNELPRFAVGALAIAGASAANGATVQITFNGSYISSTGGNHLDTDIGNDGTHDISRNGFSAWWGGLERIMAGITILASASAGITAGSG
jgi:hypothetical protein